jgi:hypothetical protein
VLALVSTADAPDRLDLDAIRQHHPDVVLIDGSFVSHLRTRNACRTSRPSVASASR